MIVQTVAAMLTGAADGAAAVASQWPVILAGYAGGFTREVWTSRKRKVEAAALAKASAEAAIVAHVAECPARVT